MNVAVQESDAGDRSTCPLLDDFFFLPNRFHKVTWLLALKSNIRLTCLKSVFEANQQQQPGCKFARVLSFWKMLSSSLQFGSVKGFV